MGGPLGAIRFQCNFVATCLKLTMLTTPLSSPYNAGSPGQKWLLFDGYIEMNELAKTHKQ